MKKLLFVFSILLGFAGLMNISANESFLVDEQEFTLGLPSKYDFGGGTLSYLGSFGIRNAGYFSDFAGFCVDCEFPIDICYTDLSTGTTYKAERSSDYVQGRMALGCAIKLFKTEKSYFAIAPVLDISILKNSSNTTAFFGPGIEFSYAYMFTSVFGITARCDASYWLYSIDSQQNNGKVGYLYIAPKVGLLIRIEKSFIDVLSEVLGQEIIIEDD